MRRILLGSFCFFLISAVAEPLLAQCSGKGLFARRLQDGQIEYCWYGTHYTEANAPEKVRAFFAKAVERRRAADQRRANSRRSSTTRRSARGQASTSQAPTSQPRAVSSVAASTKPVAAPISIDLFASIKTGADRDDVIAKLGRPHGSIGNLGDDGTEESWSYRLPDGRIAKVRLDKGKVTAIQLPE